MAGCCLESAPGEFIIVGSGPTVRMKRDPDTDSKFAGITSIEEVSKDGPEWVVSRRANGDQSNQGRQLSMYAKDVRTWRVWLYSASQ